MLEARNVTKSFGSGDRAVTAVNGVTMTFADGEFVAIVGRSGSGKTTLMSLLGALEQPTGGMIFVDGQDITRLSAASSSITGAGGSASCSRATTSSQT